MGSPEISRFFCHNYTSFKEVLRNRQKIRVPSASKHKCLRTQLFNSFFVRFSVYELYQHTNILKTILHRGFQFATERIVQYLYLPTNLN